MKDEDRLSVLRTVQNRLKRNEAYHSNSLLEIRTELRRVEREISIVEDYMKPTEPPAAVEVPTP